MHPLKELYGLHLIDTARIECQGQLYSLARLQFDIVAKGLISDGADVEVPLLGGGGVNDYVMLRLRVVQGQEGGRVRDRQGLYGIGQ